VIRASALGPNFSAMRALTALRMENELLMRRLGYTAPLPFGEYRDDPLALLTRGLGQFVGDTWFGWRAVLKAVYGRPMDAEEVAFFRDVAQRDPPGRRVREFWPIVGRRGGKDSVASGMAIEAARFADGSVALRPGERLLIPIIATDRDQAAIAFNYVKGYFETVPALGDWLSGELPTSYRSGPIALRNSTDVQVTTNSFRAPRGRAIPFALGDEIAFWRSDDSATPDVEVFRAIKPGMSMIPNAMFVGISTPYAKKGLLNAKYRETFGRNDPDVLVIQAPTRKMNPLIDVLRPGLIDKAYADDPESARAEYGAEFRDDVSDYVPRELVESLVVKNRPAIRPETGVEYFAFVDPSGGSIDSFALAVAHATDEGVGILDLVKEWRAPFSPSVVVRECAETIARYGLYRVTGDRYGGEWPPDEFAKHGVEYVASERFKSDIYRDAVPILTSRQAELLDDPRLVSQIASLERRTARGGKDSIDHPPRAHDDVANAALGALVNVVNKDTELDVWRRMAA
jgi:hypothetical protein